MLCGLARVGFRFPTDGHSAKLKRSCLRQGALVPSDFSPSSDFPLRNRGALPQRGWISTRDGLRSEIRRSEMSVRTLARIGTTAAIGIAVGASTVAFAQFSPGQTLWDDAKYD